MIILSKENSEDPAKSDPELERKLKENKKIADARTREVNLVTSSLLFSIKKINPP